MTKPKKEINEDVGDILDLHRNFIENQKQQIELAKQLIECANDNEDIIRMANEMIKSCKKAIEIEQNMNNKRYDD